MIGVMHEPGEWVRVELEYHRPPVAEEVRIHVARVLALGYVGLCVVGLVAMGVIMAMRL